LTTVEAMRSAAKTGIARLDLLNADIRVVAS